MISTVSAAWERTLPNSCVGILVMHDVRNLARHAGLEARKTAIEADLRSRYGDLDRPSLRQIPALQAYDAFYRQFRKTYHLQLQLESIVLKGKPIPSGAALVEAMFMAELEDLLLTAGHDLDLVRGPLSIDVSTGLERFTRINGQEQELKAGDMYIRDAEGVLSSVIYGPDMRTRITERTAHVLFTTYGPEDITKADVLRHLEHIRDYVLLFSPDGHVERIEVLPS